MQSSIRYLRIRAAAAATLAALSLALALPAARAENARTGEEPWYRQATAAARQQAQALFAQAIDKHQQLLRGDALALYEQALAAWDNPDIRWNLALVLDDLGQYQRAYEELGLALRWGETLGPERLREVRDRMAALETQRLARIEALREEPAAEITLDGKPWAPLAGRRSAVVTPGEHYLAARKAGFFPVTRPVYVKAGQAARVPLQMDEDRLLETRRWSTWKPWAVVGAGAAVAVIGTGLEWRAFSNRHAAAVALSRCTDPRCDAAPSDLYGRAGVEHGFAVGTFVAGGATIAAGLALAWLNQPHARRTEARPPSGIELAPIVSPRQVALAAQLRF